MITILLSENPNEICDKFKILQQQKQAGNNSDIINQKIVAIFDKLIEEKCINPNQPKEVYQIFNLI